MFNNENVSYERYSDKLSKYIYMFLATTVILFVSLYSYSFIKTISQDERAFVEEGLITQARAHFDNMVVARRWNAMHGGVFVNKREGLEPNPYLKNNVKLDSDGNTMIKINPAWMTRQISNLSNKEGNHYYKITSLKPINPNNKPDSFEVKALKYFELNKNKKYYYEFSDKFDFVGSLKTEKSCLKCHAIQGYKLGDVRGGIRVSLPIDNFNATMKSIDKQESYYSRVIIIVAFIFIILLLYIINLIYNFRFQQNELKKKENLLSNAQEIAKLGYWRFDFRNNSLLWSQQTYKILELEDNKCEASYDIFLAMVHPDDRQRVNDVYLNFLKTKIPYEIAHRLQMNDGRVKYVVERCETRFDEDSYPIEAIGTIQDVTAIQNANQQIIEKDKIILVQSRHAAMGEMIGMIAHQWRQPISVISMNASNILADIELEVMNEGSLQGDAQSIINQTKELSNTIEDFRNFFKPDKVAQEIALSKIINDVLDVIGKSLENNNIEIVLNMEVEIVFETYSRELMQVLLNLVKNAKDILIEKSEDHKRVTISSYMQNEFIEISVCDTGGGVNEENFEKIFEPYFSTKSEKNGTGIGLYMSKTIVEKHLLGTLSVENKNGGACFKIRVPCKISN